MDYFQIVYEHRSLIYYATRHAVIHGLQEAWKRCESRGLQPQEPDLVAGLVLEAIPMVGSLWKNIFHQHGLSFALTGVFCHQSPMVHHPRMTRSGCELGDLLIAHVHKANDGHVSRNALLLQAKVSHSQPHRITANEKDQLELYLHWPDFTYVRPGPLTGTKRSVRPKTAHAGAQYLLIYDRAPTVEASGLLGFPGTYPVGVCMPSRCLYDHSDLSSESLRFLMHLTGRPFDAKSANGHDGWTDLVWDILSVSIHKAFNRKRSGWVRSPRIPDLGPDELDAFSFSTATSPSAYNVAKEILGSDADVLYTQAERQPPRTTGPRDDWRESESGVSVVLIETEDQEGE